VVKELTKKGIQAAAIHGNKSQNARQEALKSFKNGRMRVLVATDIASRGIDIDELSHVINFDLPNISETYVHRIGRTGRAGASGIAMSFCDAEERAYLNDIQKLTGNRIPVVKDHPYVGEEEHAPAQNTNGQTQNRRNHNGQAPNSNYRSRSRNKRNRSRSASMEMRG
jgi:ATP-dependent RNA helicase RhlE